MLFTDILERQLLDALPVGAYALDLDGRITGAHQPIARFGDELLGLSGARAEELRDRPIWELTGESLPREQVERAIQVLRTGRQPIVRWEIVRGRGADQKSVLAQMTPLHDESHAVTGFVLSTVDVTASHRGHEAAAEAGLALARTIELDRAYHEAAHHLRSSLRPDVIVIALVDPDAPDDPSAPPRVVYDAGTDDDRRTTERRFGAVWRDALQHGEQQMRRAGGAVLELTAPLVGEQGAFGVITVLVDDGESPEKLLDARRLLDAIAGQTAAAVERARLVAHSEHRRRIEAIGEIASGVAQELRNPIFGISSAAQLLRFRAREDPVMEKNVGRILREVERLNRMVTTLVELGRPVSLKRYPGDPDAVWDAVLETERGRLESRAVAVQRTAAEHPVTPPIDAEQLAQAFRSILSNAAEAAPEASDIRLVSTALPNGAWRCRLSNGGPPIPPDVLPRVFDLFVSTKPGSTGTGLAMARRIVEEHGGSIAIESTAESGTTVTVTLRS